MQLPWHLPKLHPVPAVFAAVMCGTVVRAPLGRAHARKRAEPRTCVRAHAEAVVAGVAEFL